VALVPEPRSQIPCTAAVYSSVIIPPTPPVLLESLLRTTKVSPAENVQFVVQVVDVAFFDPLEIVIVRSVSAEAVSFLSVYVVLPPERLFTLFMPIPMKVPAVGITKIE
jgi:hypothetical protein